MVNFISENAENNKIFLLRVIIYPCTKKEGLFIEEAIIKKEMIAYEF